MELDELKKSIEDAEKVRSNAREEYLAAKTNWETQNKIVLNLKSEYNEKSGNLDDMEWLIKHPEQPGQCKALEEKIKELYGGLYNGILFGGYVHDGNYIPIQQAFDLRLRDYDGETSYRENIEHFMENFLQYMKPFETISSRYDDSFPEVSVVGFQYESTESGLSYIGYEPIENVWYHYTMVYSTSNPDKKFKTLEQALDYIYDNVR